jgi:anti-sigma regulatory factor (Ser/Thr protein kinase)
MASPDRRQVAPAPVPDRHGFSHEALMYAGDDAFLAGTGGFIRGALAAEEPILAVLDRRKIGLLRDELGPDAEYVHFADMAEVGANPARIIPAWRSFLRDHASPESGVRGIGEPIWAGRSRDELVECQLHEALLNHAFDDDPTDFRLLCPYDTASLAPSVLQEAHCSHRLVAAGERWAESAAFRDGHALPPQFATPLPEPAAATGVREYPFDLDTLGIVRRVVGLEAAEAGVGAMRTEDFLVAVHELASNSIRHGGGDGVLRVWSEPDAVVCEVRDGGRITDPLVGRVAPGGQRIGGWGLWLANQLCDLVQVRTGADGTTVRVRLAR